MDADGEEDEDYDEQDDGVCEPSYREWVLPSSDFYGLWETLYYEASVKQRLLQYAQTAILFADKGVNPQIVSWNR